MKIIIYILLIYLSIQGKAKGYLKNISSEKQYVQLSRSDENMLFGTVESMKGVFHLKRKKVYFLHKKFRLHYHFCVQYLNYKENIHTFNRDNYAQSSRRQFILFNINRVKNDSLYFVDFSVGEDHKKEEFLLLKSKLDTHFLSSENIGLKYLINTNALRENLKDIDSTILLKPQELYGKTTYQVLQDGNAEGLLIADTLCKDRDENRIVILTKDFIEPPPAIGYISTVFLTPLSHLSVLSHSQKIPLVSFIDPKDWLLLKKLEGGSVHFQTKKGIWKLDKIKAVKKRKKRKVPRRYISNQSSSYNIIPMWRINSHQIRLVGAKAANFGELKLLSRRDKNFLTPEGAGAIPFSVYLKHCKDAQIPKMLKKLYKIESDDTLKVYLKKIRSAIKAHPVDSVVLSDIVEFLKHKQGPFNRFRFRSSANVEDIEGFTGAGLYKSTSVVINENVDSLAERAMKKVWCSLWSYRAFKGREKLNVAHETAAMGILVHRSFPNEQINGISITKNLYRKLPYGFILNMQKGDVSVVSYTEESKPEQSVTYIGSSNFFTRNNSVEYITYSSDSQGVPLLSLKNMTHLSKTLMGLKKHFYKKWGRGQKFSNFAIDIEFKYDKGATDTSVLYIKQVRPY